MMSSPQAAVEEAVLQAKGHYESVVVRVREEEQRRWEGELAALREKISHLPSGEECLHTYTHTHTQNHTYTHTHIPHSHVHTYTHTTFTRTHIHMHIHVYIPTLT